MAAEIVQSIFIGVAVTECEQTGEAFEVPRA